MLDQYKLGTLNALARYGIKVAKGGTMNAPAWRQDLAFAQHGVPSHPNAPLAPHLPAPPAREPVHVPGPRPSGGRGGGGDVRAIPEWGRDLLFARHGVPSHTGPSPEAAPAATPRASTSWSEFNQGAQHHVAETANPSAIAMTPRVPKNTPIAPHLPAPPGGTPPRAPTPGGGGGRGALSRFKLPGGVKGTLGLAALGALGAGAYGLHKQHAHDLENERMVYAPMQGGFY